MTTRPTAPRRRVTTTVPRPSHPTPAAVPAVSGLDPTRGEASMGWHPCAHPPSRRPPCPTITVPRWRVVAVSARPDQDTPERLLTPDEVARWLGKPKATLYAWRSRGLGPRGIRVGNLLRYRRSEVEAWLDAHTDQR